MPASFTAVIKEKLWKAEARGATQYKIRRWALPE